MDCLPQHHGGDDVQVRTNRRPDGQVGSWMSGRPSRELTSGGGWHSLLSSHSKGEESDMPFNINHIHLKAPDPKKTADWYVKAFNLEIVSDTVRDSGDRFIRCRSENGIAVNISGARTNEEMGQG